uniref:hypothetical protein n=1 Tax=Rhodococcus globerulus TaxID=33008 RepID=UPI00374E6FAC
MAADTPVPMNQLYGPALLSAGTTVTGTVTLLKSAIWENVATTPMLSYRGHHYPVEIINHCVWLHFRFPLSFREVEELILERSVTVSYETMVALRGLNRPRGREI